MNTDDTGKLDSDHATPMAPSSKGGFVATRWTVVLNAGRNDTTHAREALTQLCQTYWYVLYAYVRRKSRRSCVTSFASWPADSL